MIAYIPAIFLFRAKRSRAKTYLTMFEYRYLLGKKWRGRFFETVIDALILARIAKYVMFI